MRSPQSSARLRELSRGNESVLARCGAAVKSLPAVEVDRLRAKPKVAIIGEFWAMTTEGDGNYHLQRFIESEGGENDIQTLVNWLLYTLWEMRHDTERRMTLRAEDDGVLRARGSDVGYKMAGVWLGELALRATFATFCKGIGLERHTLPDMDEVAKVGHSFYNNELRGGEGHMEVAKLVLNVAKQKATHDAQREAVWLHAELRRLRRHSNGHHRASSGRDLLPGRDQRRRRGQLLLPRADVHVQGA